ncbi:hypothetical protein MesoLj113a_50900 [Mesorhizobium sp. 113-1-2]|uniref:hypothetical protein n=1 Tax=Mesorhizobium sp. 113-1-2 TaxID=2744515 RepID=UPI0008199EA1|nr:hypothetical protein [Mesorhizobium sp. 113-1-2]BAV52393.1 hypothetical protein MLTONO_7491 [Mesorhizobium loti]BCG73932.1 hypothetical protein MesoLj113a_50900 [Mesorhizobium sp. 113-1-2]
MSENPVTTYIVSVFDKPHWRTILTTKDKAEAEAMEQAILRDGVKAQIEEITPKAKSGNGRRRAAATCQKPQQLAVGRATRPRRV